MSNLEIVSCPEIVDRESAKRCSLPAEVLHRAVHEYVTSSGLEPVEHVQVRCLEGHFYFGLASLLDNDSGSATDTGTAGNT